MSGRSRRSTLALAIAALAAACGRKAPPRPPQWVIPRSPEPVQVSAVPDGLKVAWKRPRAYVDGTSLEDLGGFLVLRACAPDEDAFQPIAQLPVTDRERFRKGQTFSVVDHDVGPDFACRYRVIAITVDDYSSPPAEGVFPPPPPTPTPEPGATPTADEAEEAARRGQTALPDEAIPERAEQPVTTRPTAPAAATQATPSPTATPAP